MIARLRRTGLRLALSANVALFLCSDLQKNLNFSREKNGNLNGEAAEYATP